MGHPMAVLQYFEPSGKLFKESKLELIKGEYELVEERLPYAYMDKISERIRTLSKNQKLPEMKYDWLDLGGYIYMYVPDLCHPCLIK